MKPELQDDPCQPEQSRWLTDLEERLFFALKGTNHTVARFLLRGVPHQVDISQPGIALISRQFGNSWIRVGDLLAAANLEASKRLRVLGVQPFPGSHSLLVRASKHGIDMATTYEVIVGGWGVKVGHFYAPPGKGGLRWQDENTVLAFVATDESELTRAGHPRIVRLWRRGEALEDALILAEVPRDAVTVTVSPLGDRGHLVMEQYSSGRRWYVRSDHQVHDLRLPRGSQAWAGSAGVYVSLAGSRGELTAQSLVYFPVASSGHVTSPELVLRHAVPVNVVPFDKGVAVVTTAKGEERLFHALRNDGRWSLHCLGRWAGACNIVKADQEKLTVSLSAPMTPPRTVVSRPGAPLSESTTRLQYHSLKDIGYHLCTTRMDYPAPTLVCVYGGFGAAVRPGYYPELDVGWISLGFNLVLAHVRGGGENGADWALSGMREGKIRAAEDLALILQDLVDSGLTDRTQLTCLGSSNGGLLAALACIRHPGLVRAVVLNNALLDLSLMEKTDAGRGWIEEYGSWATDSEVIRSYSPIHQLPADCRLLPEFLVCAQRNDDRIDPRQAREFTNMIISRGGRATLIQGDGSHRGPTECTAGANLLAKIFRFLHSAVTKELKC